MRTKVKSSVQLASAEALVLGELEAWLNRTGSVESVSSHRCPRFRIEAKDIATY